MNATYSETTMQGKSDLPLLQQATAYLEEVIGRSMFLDQLQTEWDRGQDQKGRPLYTLRLAVQEENVSASFTRRGLRDRRGVRRRLLTTWGDLLQLISHKQLEKLKKGSDGA